MNASGSAKRRWRRLDVCEFDANQLQGGQGWYVTWIAVDPSNPAIVYVAGAAGINSVLRSVNSGGIWTDIHTGLGGTTSPHVDHHGVDFDFNGRLLDGDDGGYLPAAIASFHGGPDQVVAEDLRAVVLAARDGFGGVGWMKADALELDRSEVPVEVRPDWRGRRVQLG